MSLADRHPYRVKSRAHFAWLLPIFALSPLALAAKGCDNVGVVGDNCAAPEDCPTGSAGKGSSEPTEACSAATAGACLDGNGYCQFPRGAECGVGDRPGVCKPKPESCDLSYSPVCGCDGETYDNSCAAQSAGVSIARSGECDEPPGGGAVGATCGGIAGLPCEDGLYCNFPVETQCGAGDQTGTCTPVAKNGCTKELNEVCGCDDVTYGNPCMAASAGASIAHLGACNSAGQPCGEVGGCAEGEFCRFPPEARCGAADAPGVCTQVPPEGSPCDAIYDPVCGCNGKTYGNSCEALTAGISVAAEGECESPPAQDCGGLLGLECKKGYFCDYPAAMACGAADGMGTCKALPSGCPDNVDPVCGCDGEEYFNACEANANGTDVAYQGECQK